MLRRKVLFSTLLILSMGCFLETGKASQIATVAVSLQPFAPPKTLDSTFAGLSYEKSMISRPLFNAGNQNLIALFKRLGPSVLRMGGNTVDKTTWNPTGPGGVAGQVSPADIDRLAGFIKAVKWRIIYGINMASNTPAAAAEEAAYVAKSFGHQLYGLEIGNECDLYHSNGLRPATYSYADFKQEWESYAAQIRLVTPGVALTGPASAYNLNYTTPFSGDEKNLILLLTQHYYRANGQDPNSTLSLLLTPDPGLLATLKVLSQDALASKISRGYRLAEANSFYNGGSATVSNTFGTALWAIDFLFTNALNNSTGINFHGGNTGPYTPIANDANGNVIEARPVYYGMYLFSLAAKGALLGTTVNADGLNFSAYAVSSHGSVYVLLNNKESTAVSSTITLMESAKKASSLILTAPELMSTTGVTLGGSPIASDDSWNGDSAALPVSGKILDVTTPPGSANLIQIQ